jgi:ABC-type transport system involved in multi-copper enzyme maturation permease subunit
MRAWKSTTGLVVLGLVALVTLLIGGVSIWFNEDPPVFPYAAKVLVTTFAGGMTILAIAAMSLWRQGNQTAWLGLWDYPAFFVAHVALFGTWIPDAVLAVVAAAALLLGRPGTPSAS